MQKAQVNVSRETISQLHRESGGSSLGLGQPGGCGPGWRGVAELRGGGGREPRAGLGQQGATGKSLSKAEWEPRLEEQEAGEDWEASAGLGGRDQGWRRE